MVGEPTCRRWHDLYGVCELPYRHDGPHARVPGGSTEANTWTDAEGCACPACQPLRHDKPPDDPIHTVRPGAGSAILVGQTEFVAELSVHVPAPNSGEIAGTILGVIGYTITELRDIWADMCADPDAWKPLEKRLVCMAVGLVNQLAPLRAALIAASGSAGSGDAVDGPPRPEPTPGDPGVGAAEG